MYGGYFKGFSGASKLRALVMNEHTMDGVLEVLLNFDEDDANLRVPAAAVRAVAVKASLPVATRAQTESV